jgi:hypothetical protein
MQEEGTEEMKDFSLIIPVQFCCLRLAGSITVSMTRTAVATTLILTYLSGGSKYKFGDSSELIDKFFCDRIDAVY